MRPELLKLLREPGTEAPLEARATTMEGDRIWQGELISSLTGRRFPILDGIPRFVPRANYAGSFGLQWNQFADAQLDSATGAARSLQRFDHEVGWDRGDLEGLWTVDAGAGAGRFTEIAAARGARLVALDYSTAVEATANTFRDAPNVYPVQGDILNPPFAARTFPRVYSIGVLQHTPEPYGALRSLLRLCQIGGKFAVTAYGRRSYTLLNGKYLARHLTRRLPPPMLLRAIERVMPILFPITDHLFRVPVVGPLARFAIPVATYADTGELSRRQRYAEAVLDTFDMLSPTYDAPLAPGRVRALLDAMNIRDIEWVSEIPVNVRGTV